MSGIAGFVHFDGRAADRQLLRQMTACMDHRGPDGITHSCRGTVALGHCALVTTEEQRTEIQPLQDDRGECLLVFDGRVDNRPELGRELRSAGVALRDTSDAELVLNAYRTWRTDCAKHIDGEFAFAVWDARSATLFCARDRVGLRPFHYHWNGTTLAFASDVHAVLALPWVPQQLQEAMVAQAIAAEHCSLDETFWKHVFRLPAATRAVFSTRGVHIERYWQPDPAFRLPCRSEADFVAYHRELLRDVVRRQSRSHLPLACEVSGGLDSSALFAVGHALARQAELEAPGFHGYALSFSDPLADESSYRKALSGFVGEPIREVAPGRYSVSWYLAYGARFHDVPGSPNWTMGQTLHAAARSDGCKVVFNGTGGDEWLGASRDWRTTALVTRHWAPLRDHLAAYAREGGYAAAAKEVLRWGMSELLPEAWQEWIRFRRGLPVPSYWLSPALARSLRASRARMRSARTRREDAVWSLQLDVLRDPDGQIGREQSERLAALCGIEARQPFWDRRIVEAAFATPEWLRVHGGEDKWLHRRTMQGLLPPEILARDDKANFHVMAKQQREELAPVMDALRTRRAAWLRPGRMRPPAEYAGRGARADFGQWALLMADALASPGMEDCPSRKESDVNEDRDGSASDATRPAPAGRKPYRAPQLVHHGSVRELTLGGQGASPDAKNKQKAKPPKKSERALKQDIVRIGTHPLGIGLYLFEYKPGVAPRGRHFGVMAEEVEQVMPEAVVRGADGIRRVRHELLGIEDLAGQERH